MEHDKQDQNAKWQSSEDQLSVGKTCSVETHFPGEYEYTKKNSGAAQRNDNNSVIYSHPAHQTHSAAK